MKLSSPLTILSIAILTVFGAIVATNMIIAFNPQQISDLDQMEEIEDFDSVATVYTDEYADEYIEDYTAETMRIYPVDESLYLVLDTASYRVCIKDWFGDTQTNTQIETINWKHDTMQIFIAIDNSKEPYLLAKVVGSRCVEVY